jgi:pyrimidine operon attenuation protein / uracil phosphoribosyltransferase
MNLKVGRVTPCAPGFGNRANGAHGVTRPTSTNRFRGSRREKRFWGILTLTLSPGEREQPLVVFSLPDDHLPNSNSLPPKNLRPILPLLGERVGVGLDVTLFDFPPMPEAAVILNAVAIQRALTRIAHEIAERNESSAEVVLVGIPAGGLPMAQRLSAILAGIWGQPVLTGSLDVSMHRDDLDRRAAPKVHPTVIPFDVTGKTVVLVDDVLFSGRTIRAALDALNDFGRPKRIQLAVLVDRGHRELPIKADFVGKNVPTSLSEKIHVRIGQAGAEDEVVLEK